jgi:hypothetical protein
MPSRLIEEDDGMFARRDAACDFLKMQIHRLGVANGQDERRGLAVLGADRAEDIGRGGALIVRS